MLGDVEHRPEFQHWVLQEGRQVSGLRGRVQLLGAGDRVTLPVLYTPPPAPTSSTILGASQPQQVQPWPSPLQVPASCPLLVEALVCPLYAWPWLWLSAVLDICVSPAWLLLNGKTQQQGCSVWRPSFHCSGQSGCGALGLNAPIVLHALSQGGASSVHSQRCTCAQSPGWPPGRVLPEGPSGTA